MYLNSRHIHLEREKKCYCALLLVKQAKTTSENKLGRAIKFGVFL